MPSAQWKSKTNHTRWYPDETLDVAIGQGAVEATPIQLARIIGGIASGGRMRRPHVVFPNQLPDDVRKFLLEDLLLDLVKQPSIVPGKLEHHY